MKCLDYDPDVYGCLAPVLGKCPGISAMRCEQGWITFWTPAERAGLKAMGKQITPGYSYYGIPVRKGWAEINVIRAYVQAVRKAKDPD